MLCKIICCGSHTVIFLQSERGFVHLTGVDYSPGAVELSKKVFEKECIYAEFIVRESMPTNVLFLPH